MAPVNGRPFLTYILTYLHRSKTGHVILATGYLHHKIEEYYRDNFRGIPLSYSVEAEPLGTGGALKVAFKKATSEDVLVMNGDTFFDVSLKEIREVHRENSADLTIALKPMHDISRYGAVQFAGTRITSFKEKQRMEFGYINGGIYLAKKNLFETFDLPNKFSFEEDFLKKFTADLNMQAFISDSYFIDIGVPEDYQRAQKEMQAYE